ncbi:MAG: guanylate kinase [Flavobacteriales bacterium]
MENGKLIIFSAPSGAGKSTIVSHLLQCYPSMEFSISACSRDPRGEEVHGKEYYFLGVDGFKAKIKENAFVEWEEVYENNFYGTLKSELERIWSKNGIAVFDIDVVGGVNLKKQFGENALSVFVKPPSIQELENRLRNRQTETEEKLQMRLAKAEEEMTYATRFDVVLENDVLERALRKSEYIIEEFLSK